MIESLKQTRQTNPTGENMIKLKLTDKTRYTIEEGTATIYARKPNSDKWEPAFKCHHTVINLIKKDGLNAALKLLTLP